VLFFPMDRWPGQVWSKDSPFLPRHWSLQAWGVYSLGSAPSKPSSYDGRREGRSIGTAARGSSKVPLRRASRDKPTQWTRVHLSSTTWGKVWVNLGMSCPICVFYCFDFVGSWFSKVPFQGMDLWSKEPLAGAGEECGGARLEEEEEVYCASCDVQMWCWS
jgi:hypothetical protein